MSKDQFDEQVERLLPCPNQSCKYREYPRCTTLTDCPAHYRPAIATALREADNDRHQQLLWCDKKWQTIIEGKEKEIADLRAELKEANDLMECWKQIEDERDQLKAQVVEAEKRSI